MAVCIFCGTDTRLTKAHIYRKAWIDALTGGSESYGHEHTRDNSPARTWAAGTADFKVKCVCADCNGGWMNDLDCEAERIFLDEAVRGNPCELGPEGCATVARWCALVAVLWSYAQSDPTVSPATAQLVKAGQLPEGTRIWTFMTDPDEFVAWGNPKEWGLGEAVASSPEEPTAYFVTFGVGRFVAQVFIPTESTPPMEFDRKNALEAGILNELSLLSQDRFQWPPAQTVPWAKIGKVMDAFQAPREAESS